MHRGSERPPLSVRAYRHFSEHGFRSLVEQTVELASLRLTEARALSTAELEQLVLTCDSIWYDKREDPLKITPPADPRLQKAFANYPKKFFPSRSFVCEVPNCHIIGRLAAAMYRGDRLLYDTTRRRLIISDFESMRAIAKHAIWSKLGRSPKDTVQILFPLVCLDPSYYHWVAEFLPKLRLLELYEQKTGREPTILIESDPRDFITESLELAGYRPDKCMEWNEVPINVETLVVPTHRPQKFDHDQPSASPYQPSQRDFNWVRERMRSQIPENKVDQDANKRIYISRQRASRGRRIVNNDEVEQELAARGFESHILENYHFKKQVEIFMQADAVIGPHGAGLTNILFSVDPVVIELLPETVLRPHFYFLASILGFEYEGVVTDSEGDDLLVDIDILRDRLDRVGL